MASAAEYLQRKYTYGDYIQWVGDERWELYAGEPVLMSPAPSARHQTILLNITRILFQNFKKDDPCKVFIAPFDVRMPEGEEEDKDIRTVLQPDILIHCQKAKLDERGLRGAPEVVFEILSPSTAQRDLKIKKDLYEKYGVEEYWIVDPENESILVYSRAGEEFSEAKSFSGEEIAVLNTFPDIVISAKEIF